MFNLIKYTTLSFSIVFLFLYNTSFSFSQGLDLTGKDNTPIEVTASDGIELNQNEQKVTALKNAEATRGDNTIFADSIEAYYRKSINNNNEIWKLTAKNNVKMTSPTNTAKGDFAEYTIDNNLLILTGHPAHFFSSTDHVTADSLEYYQDKELVIAKGKAQIIRESNTLTADEISALFKKNQQNHLETDLMNAQGNVTITTGTETATGEKASYNPKTGIAVLLGNVKLVKDRNYMTGEKAVVNLKTGISKLYAGQDKNNPNSRAKGVFLPEDMKDGINKKP